MHRRLQSQPRKGAVLVLVVLLIIPLLAFVALSIDIGMIATARTQCQAAADSAAMAGARTFTGESSEGFKMSSATPNALAAAMTGVVLQNAITDEQVTIELGRYSYNTSLGKFETQIPGSDTENWTLVKSTVNYSGNHSFAKVMGMSAFAVSTTATAVHRPRDVAMIMDFSGSMRFDSLVGIGYSGDRSQSNNPETVYPQFGHYSATASAALQNTAASTTISDNVYGSANVTTGTAAGDPIVDDFYQHSAGTTPSVKAFTAWSDAYATAPGGDNFLKMNKNTGANYAQSVSEIIYNNNTTTTLDAGWEDNGYDSIAGVSAFAGHTDGPRHWGKTFFVWPPDPRPANGAIPAKDWRQRFFFKRNTSTGVQVPLDDNTLLWDSSGNWRMPGTTVSISGTNYCYSINYNAILDWLKESPNPFPTRLRAGRIVYYDAIPTSITTTGFPPTWPTNNNERFFKDFIDHCLGVEQSSSGSSYTTTKVYKRGGYGDDYTWGTVKISNKPTVPADPTGQVNNGSGYAVGHTGAITVDGFTSAPTVGQYVTFDGDATVYKLTAVSGSTSITLDKALVSAIVDNQSVEVTNTYMDYRDNPKRPKVHFWFGPMSMIDFMGNYNRSRFWWPGTCHESPVWQSKVGVQAALRDIKSNHPNDTVALIYFSTPKASSSDSSGRFNRVRAPLGQNYQRMIDALWFPLSTIDTPGTEIRPYDTENEEVPRAKGGTCYPIGFMLAYNQFSGNPALVSYATSNGLSGAPSGDAGGLGRKGAQKLIIFQTDGMVNVDATATFNNSGAHNSYYQVRQPVEFPSSVGGDATSATNNLYNSSSTGIVDRICALETAASPGYSTVRKPVLIHCLAFGTLFEPSTTDADKALALDRLQNIQFLGGKAGGEQPTASTALASYKRIIGTSAERIDKLREAISAVMQDGVQVSLIE